MRSFRVLILTVGLLVVLTTSLVQAESPNLQSTSWMWADKEMSVNYSFGQDNKGIAKIILTENNFGYQLTKEGCHLYVPFNYQKDGNLLYASLAKRNEVQVSQISFAPDAPEQKLQTQEVKYFVRTYSAISGEREERLLGTPQFLEKVKN